VVLCVIVHEARCNSGCQRESLELALELELELALGDGTGGGVFPFGLFGFAPVAMPLPGAC